MTTWKKRERQIAAYFGTTRAPLSGGNGKQTRSDSLHPDLFVEEKLRASHSAVTLWRDTKKKADKEDKIPIVALAEKNKAGFWLVIHTSDFDKVVEMREVAIFQKKNNSE